MSLLAPLQEVASPMAIKLGLSCLHAFHFNIDGAPLRIQKFISPNPVHNKLRAVSSWDRSVESDLRR